MFVASFKPNRKTLLYIVILIVMIVIGFIIFTNLRSDSNEDGQTITISLKAETEEDRLAFIQALGWEVDPSTVSVEEVMIPAEFNDVYLNYNELQKQNGFDLEKYKGQRVRKYTYTITNYPDEGAVQMHMLVFEGAIIGGDISSAELDGFMVGLLDNSPIYQSGTNVSSSSGIESSAETNSLANPQMTTPGVTASSTQETETISAVSGAQETEPSSAADALSEVLNGIDLNELDKDKITEIIENGELDSLLQEIDAYMQSSQ